MYNIDQKAVIWRKIESEVVLLNLSTGHYYTLNDIGLSLWDGILSNLSPEAIAQKLVEEFEVNYKTALKDICECIEQLRKEGLLTLQTAPVAGSKNKLG